MVVAARLQEALLVPRRPPARDARRLLLRRDHERLRGHVRLLGADRRWRTAGRSWPTCARSSSARTRGSRTCPPIARSALDAPEARHPLSSAAPAHARFPRAPGASRPARSRAGSPRVRDRAPHRPRPVLPLLALRLPLLDRGCRSAASRSSLISHLTGGMWGLLIRRFLEAGTRLFPLLVVLFLPVAARARSALPLDASRPGLAPPAQGALPERALLPRPRRLLLRGLDPRSRTS